MGLNIGFGPSVGLFSIKAVIGTILALTFAWHQINLIAGHFDTERNVLITVLIAMLIEAVPE